MGRSELVDGIVATVPGKIGILRALARLPPAWRSLHTYRASAALARRTAHKPPAFVTNLGMHAGLLFEVPADHFVALFGTPDLYAGERGALALAAHLSHHADAFVDIGAHVGYFTTYVATHGRPDVPIVFLEPDVDLFRALERNVQASRLRHVRGFSIAVGDTDGTRPFYRNRTDSLSGSLTPMFSDRHDIDCATVAVRTFAGLATELGFRRACVKVDVEGAEAAFVAGARPAVDRIAFLIMEVLGPAHRDGFVAKVIAETGWHAYYINDEVLEPSLDGSFQYREPEYNWLFCDRSPAALADILKGSRLRVAESAGRS